MMLHVHDIVEQCADGGSRGDISASLSRAQHLTGHVYDLGNAEVRSSKQMGTAMGLWETRTQQMSFRSDLFTTPEGRQLITHVAVHEALHADGVLLEGFAEAGAAWLTGEDPMAYHDEVRAAQDFFKVVGREESLELARQDNAETGLIMAYVRRKVGAHIPLDTEKAPPSPEKLRSLFREAAALLTRCDVKH